jgi:ABC-type uncharacterized transport system permease subunit
MTDQRRQTLLEVARTIGTVAAALLLGFIITVLVSEEPVAAYKSFLLGPVSRINRLGNWIEESINLCLVGLAICLVFRARQFSLAAEGQIYLGALASGLVGLYLEVPAILHISLALIAAAIIGFLWGLIPGVLKSHLNANEIVSTLMLNEIAIRIYNLILTYRLKPPTAGYTVSDYLHPTGLLPRIVAKTRVTPFVFIAVAAVIAVYIVMYRTPFGYALRMTGANIRFAHYGGINTKRVIYLTMAISGISAALAGAHLTMGIHQRVILNVSTGLGFEGIVVSLLARNNPLLVPFTALFYGYLRAGANIMERASDVSRELVMVIQAVIILLVTAEGLLAFLRRRVTIRREGAHVP